MTSLGPSSPAPAVIYRAADGIALLTFNRPECANAIDFRFLADLGSALDAINLARDVRVVIVTGAGCHFCAGADLNAAWPSDPGNDRSSAVQVLFGRFETLPQPVIAAINGAAMGGGCEIALACDIRIMADTATIGLPEIQLGILPAGGGTQRLPRIVGAGIARELILTGRHLEAAEALRIGLVSHVVPAARLMLETMTLAGELMRRSPDAVAAAKRLLSQSFDVDFRAGLELERRAVEALAAPGRREAPCEDATGPGGVKRRDLRP